MAYYKVILEGKGIDVPSEKNGSSIAGFFTTRLVRASSTEEAEEKAITAILTEWASGQYARCNRGPLPTVTVSSIHKSNFIESLKSKYSGYSFYLDEAAQ